MFMCLGPRISLTSSRKEQKACQADLKVKVDISGKLEGDTWGRRNHQEDQGANDGLEKKTENIS